VTEPTAPDEGRYPEHSASARTVHQDDGQGTDAFEVER
jgi:hypothetical protein